MLIRIWQSRKEHKDLALDFKAIITSDWALAFRSHLDLSVLGSKATLSMSKYVRAYASQSHKDETKKFMLASRKNRPT